jgi:hypothetical protein
MSEHPSPEDISKLHAEMNQYINQRLVITTTAITIFGVVMGWVVFGLSATTQNGVKIQTQPVSLLLPTALLTVLVIMLWHCQAVVKQMHILSAYLELTGSSNWEKQYQQFAKSRKFTTQDDLPFIIFATLGILSILIPSAISLLFPPDLNFQMGMVVFAFFIFSVASIVIFFKFWNERHYHRFRCEVKNHWKTILLPESNQGLQRTDS